MGTKLILLFLMLPLILLSEYKKVTVAVARVFPPIEVIAVSRRNGCDCFDASHWTLPGMLAVRERLACNS
jgi:hypothetical protein